jgi:hypothetical protein
MNNAVNPLTMFFSQLLERKSGKSPNWSTLQQYQANEAKTIMEMHSECDLGVLRSLGFKKIPAADKRREE